MYSCKGAGLCAGWKIEFSLPETPADSELQPMITKSSHTYSNTHVDGSVYFEVLTSIKYGFNGIPTLFKKASVTSS